MQKTQDIPVIGPALRVVFGSRNERFVKRYTTRVESITAREPEMRGLTDAELRAKTEELRQRVKDGERPGDLLIQAFAIGREAMDRHVGIRNIFNPEHAAKFDPDRLPEEARSLYQQTLSKIESTEPAPPEGPYLGCSAEVPGWMQVDIPPALYEAVRELYPESRPPFRARPFDVQLIGAMVLYQGKIAEMKTGEGKTIVAPLACYLAALEGMKCHVVTVNSYLVQRDRDWTFPFFQGVGLTVGAIHPHHMQSEDVKRRMYYCDVVYGTTSEFGFDYLRDNMKRSVDAQVQRKREFAIVDEVDSILIDEARTPLIISGQAHEDSPRYELADRVARTLVELQKPWAAADEKVQACMRRIKGLEGDIRNARDKSQTPALKKQLDEARRQLPGLETERDQHTQYYEVEMDRKQAHLTHNGVEAAQREAGVGSLYVGENVDLPHLLEQAIRAHTVYERDRDYVVMPMDDPQTGQKEPAVVIVDQFTGRLQIGRQWSDGLHQAVEAKERVPIKQETQTVATITIQNFFKMYQRLAGMTGTADTEAQEFHDIYKLDVVVIPTNVPVIRRDFDDTVYLTGKDKWSSIVDEIKDFHDLGRPVLVGTTSVEKSESLSDQLSKRHSVQHEVLNAKQHEREAHIIENAGQLGAVMIATNMAGRGTDIKLGSLTREALVEHWKKRGLAPRDLTAEDDEERLREKIFRKLAPRALGMSKGDAESAPLEDLELALLRRWAEEHTFLEDKKIDRMGAEELRQALDEQGRFMLHRLRWFDTVEQLGGLHVVGTERHESRRIDNQLRGRSGRQGDRGSSRFFVSLDDDLMKMFAGETTMKVLSRLGMKEGDAIEHPMLSKSVERAQRKVEERNFHHRKQLLDYDEVMEVQRQEFYGLRQRALEGRNVKGLIFDFIDDAIWDATQRYLASDYPLECAAEYARQRLDCSIPHESLRGRDADDMIDRIRALAKEETRSMISVTLGEYMPEEAEPEDYSLTGLANWAESQFGADIKPSDVRSMSRREIEERLGDAADRKIEDTDLSGVMTYLQENYGANELRNWAKSKFEIDVPLEVITEAESNDDVAAAVTELAQDRYRRREIEYPVEFAIEMTMAMMQQSPGDAASQLVRWANARFDMGWDESVVRTKLPQQLRQDLLQASEKFVESGRLEEAVAEAQSQPDDAALEAHLQERYGASLPEHMRHLEGEEREQAVRARVESILRSEMMQLERFILLEVLDPTWKDHLYGMDQLRDAISFRSFSQQDPRIAYKREGSRLFEEMQQVLRDRVTDYVFKMRLAPRAGAQPPPSRPAQAPAQQAPAGAASQAGQTDGGPAQEAPGRDRYAGAQAQRREAPRTGAGQAAAAAKVAAASGSDVATGARASAPQQRSATASGGTGGETKVGRNDPCPCGSGMKYKKCCGRSGAPAG